MEVVRHPDPPSDAIGEEQKRKNKKKKKKSKSRHRVEFQSINQSYLISKQIHGKKYKYNTGKPENPGIHQSWLPIVGKL